jgi:hypothetical protein
MNLRSHRHIVLALTIVVYLIGNLVAIRTSIPSALAVSLVLIAGVAWSHGFAAGAAVMIACAIVEYNILVIIIEYQRIAGPSAIVILIPILMTQLVVLIALSALRRAELRQQAASHELEEKNAALQAALAEVKELRGMLPICAWCKSVRDVNGMWDRLEAYLSKHSHVTLTHGVCPTCLVQMQKELEAQTDRGEG